MTPAQRPSRGFTLVELLVVVAVVGTLIAFLLPILQNVRESARRMRCENNLKQMAFGCQRHQETHQCLPSGGGKRSEDRQLISGTPALYDQQTWGWGYQILPFIGHERLWSSTDDFTVAGSPIPIYSCPTLRPPTAFAYNAAGIWRYEDPPRLRYMMDYAGNGGSSGGFWSFSRPSDGLLTPSGTGYVSLEEIPAGAANTLMIGEKFLDPRTVRVHPCCSDDAGWVAGWDSNTIAFGSYGTPRRNEDRNDDERCTCGFVFGSSHPAGMQAAFGDGSVRTLGYSLAPRVWDALVTVHAGPDVALP
ncbi:MAG: DUF1559 domain-containing protein [Gemmataceae bacterium]